MFERFRIKATLRVEVIGLRRAEVDPQALMTVEMIFHEAAYVVAPMMRLNRWSAQQAMVFMVTDVLREAEQVGNIEILRQDDPATHAALEQLYRRVLDLTATQPELAACVSVPADGETAPFTSGRYVP